MCCRSFFFRWRKWWPSAPVSEAPCLKRYLQMGNKCCEERGWTAPREEKQAAQHCPCAPAAGPRWPMRSTSRWSHLKEIRHRSAQKALPLKEAITYLCRVQRGAEKQMSPSWALLPAAAESLTPTNCYLEKQMAGAHVIFACSGCFPQTVATSYLHGIAASLRIIFDR